MVKSKAVGSLGDMQGLFNDNRDFLKELLKDVIQEVLEIRSDGVADDKLRPQRVLSAAELHATLRRIRGVVFDFDGVFTDNRVWVSEEGHESVACWRSDGLGLARVRVLGLPMAILSTEINPVVRRRAEKLELPCLHGLKDKATAFHELAVSYGMLTSDFAYVGNDINDNECLSIAGLAVIPADAHPAVHPLANLILENSGGRGAVREFCDLLCGAQESDSK